MQTSFPSPTVPIVSAGAVEDSGDDDDDDDDYDGFADDYDYEAAKRLREVNAQLEADDTPVESHRVRKVQFRDPIDAVVCFTPDFVDADENSDDDDYDDDGDGDFVEEGDFSEEGLANASQVREAETSVTTNGDVEQFLTVAPGNSVGKYGNQLGETERYLTETDVDSGLSSAYWRRGSGSSEDTDGDKNVPDSFESDSDSVTEDISELLDDPPDNVNADKDTNGSSNVLDASPPETPSPVPSSASPNSRDAVEEPSISTDTDVSEHQISSPTPTPAATKPSFQRQFGTARRGSNGVSTASSSNNTPTKNRNSHLPNGSAPRRLGSTRLSSSADALSRSSVSATPQRQPRPKTSTSRLSGSYKLPEYIGNPRSAYGLSSDLKQELLSKKREMMLLKEQKELEEKREREERKQEAELAFQAWLRRKRKWRSANRSADASSKEDESTLATTASREESRGAFEAWLERKLAQRREEEIARRMREMELSARAKPKASREEAQAAYKAWLRKKHEEEKERRRASRAQRADRRQAALPVRSLRALEMYLQSEEFSRYPELVL